MSSFSSREKKGSHFQRLLLVLVFGNLFRFFEGDVVGRNLGQFQPLGMVEETFDREHLDFRVVLVHNLGVEKTG